MLLDCCVPGGMCVCVEDAVAPVLCLFPHGWAAAAAGGGGGVLQVGRADSLTHVDPCPCSRAPPLSLTCPNNSSVSDGLPSLQSDWTTAKTRPQTCYFRYVSTKPSLYWLLVDGQVMCRYFQTQGTDTWSTTLCNNGYKLKLVIYKKINNK